MDMTDLPDPLLPIHVGVGGTYWAAKGDTKWSAVRVLRVLRVKAEVERVIPRNQKIIHRKGKVKLDELVKRDPKLKGKDKPKAPPAEVFKEVREAREKQKQLAAEPPPKPVPQPEVKAPVARTPEEEAEAMERLAKLFDLLDDGSTTDDW
jgi:hypothetical protein